MKKYIDFIKEANESIPQKIDKQSKYMNDIALMGVSIETIFNKLKQKWNDIQNTSNVQVSGNTQKPAQTTKKVSQAGDTTTPAGAQPGIDKTTQEKSQEKQQATQQNNQSLPQNVQANVQVKK